MTLPRQILPDSVYLLSRRCTQRQFLLKPSPLMNSIFLYCLAVAAEKYHVQIHAFVVLSNHYHAVATDTRGNIPRFMAHLNKLTAKCVNASLGRWENVWAVEQPSLVKPEENLDVLGKMVYALTNPVSSFLVERSSLWPGLRMDPSDLLRGTLEAPRPKIFFREDGPMPAMAKLTLTVPEAYSHMSREEFVALLERSVEAREDELREQARRDGIRFLGLKRIARQHPTSRPRSREPRRNLNPRVAAKNKWRRIEALQRLKQFLADYREAWLRWKQGFHDVIFPAGTYAMVQNHNVACASP